MYVGFNLELGWFYTVGLLIDSQMTCFSTFRENPREQSRKIRLPFTPSLGGKTQKLQKLKSTEKEPDANYAPDTDRDGRETSGSKEQGSNIKQL